MSNKKVLISCTICFFIGMLVSYAFSLNITNPPRKFPRNMYTIWEDGKKIGSRFSKNEKRVKSMIINADIETIESLSDEDRLLFDDMKNRICTYIQNNPGQRVSYQKILNSDQEQEIYQKIKLKRKELRQSFSAVEKAAYRTLMMKMKKEDKMQMLLCIT